MIVNVVCSVADAEITSQEQLISEHTGKLIINK